MRTLFNGWAILKFKETFTIFTIGAVGYSLLEILWRGYTHWTMTITGGACFCFIYNINKKLKNISLWKKCFFGAAAITMTELTVGCIVNKLCHMDVWDYSKQPCNIFGQICLLYSVLWYFLCIPLFKLSDLLKKKLK